MRIFIACSFQPCHLASSTLCTARAGAVSGGYQKGMAVFTIAKGGLMYTATVSGQKFKYTPRDKD
jgi:hypothetical protein